MLHARVAFRRFLALPLLTVCSLLLAASAQTQPAHAAPAVATQESMTFYAVADAYVKSSTPDTNYGGSTTLHLSYSEIELPLKLEEAAVVRFDLSGLPAGAVIDTAAVREWDKEQNTDNADLAD